MHKPESREYCIGQITLKDNLGAVYIICLCSQKVRWWSGYLHSDPVTLQVDILWEQSQEWMEIKEMSCQLIALDFWLLNLIMTAGVKAPFKGISLNEFTYFYPYGNMDSGI